jgi:drug/metabolite transporter (DMT)-like permease
VKPADLRLALVVVMVWGMSFVVIKAGVGQVPPLLLGALRFLLAAFPAVLPVPLMLGLSLNLRPASGGPAAGGVMGPAS